ncbi:PD-(D/E)XK nuclease family protein [Candidatus Avelusimicrobium gallicola]|uniref:Uncharacterized protein n=1 Tax=Candidatus Avelusimicrobium gallicola TaxID=2562704 RepID=A0A1Y4DBE1_9BACT|nr:PD-(D/E)XK nuclease family protein [Elusimicrobium sp. An273]OUO56185.1 hypothetical protein B5F75_06095 [Elusimicrobium sp. An273]
MELFYAHYPSLEDAFVRRVQTRRSGVLSRWLVVCSSSLLAQRLRERLARELGAAANFYFLTAGALVSELDREAPGQPPALLPQDNLRDFLIKNLLAEPGLNRYPASRGFVQAVKSALRDLEDALAEPDVLDEHLRTAPDAVLEQDGARLEWFNRLYRRYLAAAAAVPGFRPYQQAFERALQQAENSDFLHGFDEIIFYGFYDMTGRQLELFNRLRALYAVTVFAPYLKHPAYRFAQKFFETNWLGAGSGENVDRGHFGALGKSGQFLFASSDSAPQAGVHIVSAADARGEVFYAAKEILRLTEKEGYRLSDIAVLARSLAPYQEEIQRVFAENCIAFNGSFSYPLSKFPLGVFCLNLFSLLANGFDRQTVLAVVSSPYFKPAQKNVWRRQAAQSLASRDLSQWRDLLPHGPEDDTSFLAWLEDTHARLDALARVRDWAGGAALALAFLEQNTDVSQLQGKETEIFQTVCEKIKSFSLYASIRPTVQPGEWVRELTDALTGLSFHETQAVRGGVTVTDVSRARGLQFKVVFLLGLNDKVFPLITPEDPVLRDYYRYVLRDVLGYWINQSLDRADEERLLFFAAATAGTEKLYTTYARAGQDGKEAVRSLYAAELARACGLDLAAQDAARVSGRLSERINQTESEFLTPKELSLSFILHPETAAAQYRRAGLWSGEKEHTLAAAAALRQSGALGAFDGVVQSGAEIFAKENAAGFSPSALQELGQCPLKYFLDKGLHLQEPDDPLSRQELSPDRRGTAYHEILKDFYEDLYQRGLTHEVSDAAALEYLERAFEKHCRADGYRLFGIYPVVWELILQEMKEKLSAFVLEDLHELGPYTPAWFEMPVSSEPSEELPLRLRGIIDRVDVDGVHKTFRVADYKSSRKGTKDLASDFFTHLIFQPFIYVWIARRLAAFEGYESDGSCLLSINKGYVRRDLSADAYRRMQPRACGFLKQLAEMIQTGTFFISPSDLCAYCPYAGICRRDSFKSLLRARKSAASQALEEARR